MEAISHSGQGYCQPTSLLVWHCETQAMVPRVIAEWSSWSLLRHQSWKVLRLVSKWAKTKHCDNQSQVLELVLGSLELVPGWLFGGDFLRLLGVQAAALFRWCQCLPDVDTHYHSMFLGFLCSCLWLPAADTGLPVTLMCIIRFAYRVGSLPFFCSGHSVVWSW